MRMKDAECEVERLIGFFKRTSESATVAWRKFRVLKNVRTNKEPLTAIGLIKLVRRFAETGTIVGFPWPP